VGKEQIRDFLEEVKTNANLQQKMNDEGITNESEVVKIANAAGFDFTVDDWLDYAKSARPEKIEIGDDELDQVAGGGLFGIDLCQKRWDQLLCAISMCRQLRLEYDGKATKYNSQGNVTRRYCLNGHFDHKLG
jgi:predicted ribosomally synthesized peptide with nif11-like leader